MSASRAAGRIRRLIGNAAAAACTALDAVPGYWDGRWHRYGQLGCRLGVSRIWGRWGS